MKDIKTTFDRIGYRYIVRKIATAIFLAGGFTILCMTMEFVAMKMVEQNAITAITLKNTIHENVR